MKKNVWMLLCSVILFCAGAQAQVVSDGELAVVYYMPQNQILVDITYTEVYEEAGPFVHFAEKYMGAEEAIEEDALHYEIEKVNILRQTRPDYSRAYKVVAEAGTDMQLLQLDKHGILAGYNMAAKAEEARDKKQETRNKEQGTGNREQGLTALPFLEEQMKAKTLEEMAESIAKQIFRIRENRMYLLGGEIDHAPADGKAMKLVLDELDKQERMLVELFLGKRKVKTLHKKIIYTPTKSENVIVARFSESAGFVSDESAQPLTLQINARKQVLGAAHGVVDKKAPQPSQIYYNLPGSAEVSILLADKVLDETQMPIAQLGVAIPLAKNLFAGKEPVHIEFDTKTGNVKSITK